MMTLAAIRTAGVAAALPLKFVHNGLLAATCPSGLVPDRTGVTTSGDDIHLDEADHGSNATTITGSTADVHLSNTVFDTHHASFDTECVAPS